ARPAVGVATVIVLKSVPAPESGIATGTAAAVPVTGARVDPAPEKFTTNGDAVPVALFVKETEASRGPAARGWKSIVNEVDAPGATTLAKPATPRSKSTAFAPPFTG